MYFQPKRHLLTFSTYYAHRVILPKLDMYSTTFNKENGGFDKLFESFLQGDITNMGELLMSIQANAVLFGLTLF